MVTNQPESGSNTTTSSVGPQDKREGDGWRRMPGLALIVCGLVLNEWVIGRVASPDGHIELNAVRAVIWGVDLILVLMGGLVLNRPKYARHVLLCGAPVVLLAVFSFAAFTVLELFPGLIVYLPLDYANYYHVRAHYTSDDELVFKQRSSVTYMGDSFGDLYRASYGLKTPPIQNYRVFDKNGFRNGSDRQVDWDVDVIGDSYIEFGENEDDTITRRLEVLSGKKVRNLGIGGYGPFQYIAVLKRYGLSPKARYVVFSFFEGNDIADIRLYLRWKVSHDSIGGVDLQSNKPFLRRYVTAFVDVFLVPLVRLLEGSDGSVDDLVDLRFDDKDLKTVFSYKIETRTPDELLKTKEWNVLRDLLGNFKGICEENGIVPILLFVPTAAHIYAEYSTADSGGNWTKIRAGQVAARNHVETTLQMLSREAGIELISLTPAFEEAARHGKFLYYPFDSHWNSEGRQVAASVLAERFSSGNVRDERVGSKHAPPRRSM